MGSDALAALRQSRTVLQLATVELSQCRYKYVAHLNNVFHILLNSILSSEKNKPQLMRPVKVLVHYRGRDCVIAKVNRCHLANLIYVQ
jgi:hypothetical protein